MKEVDRGKRDIKKFDIVYYARILPPVGIYEVVELKVRTVAEDFFVGTDKITKHAFMFKLDNIDKIIFFERKAALDIVKEAEKNGKKIFDEKYYEEY